MRAREARLGIAFLVPNLSSSRSHNMRCDRRIIEMMDNDHAGVLDCRSLGAIFNTGSNLNAD
jgi:hypothetical protein